MNKLILLLTFFALATSLSAQNDTVYLSFVPTDIKCGETKGIKLRVKNFTNIVSMNFSMRYNKNLINFKNFSGENANASIIANEVTPVDYADGQTFSWSKATPISVADGDFFLLNFEPKAESGGLGDSLRFTGTPVAFKFESLVAGGKKTLPYKFTNAPFRIIDQIAPTITCPNSRFVTILTVDDNIIVDEIPAIYSDVSCGKASIDYTLSGATNGGGTDSDANFETFNLGTTTVLYTAKDNSGNKASCPFQVIVTKSTDPAFYTTAPIVNCSDSTFSIETRVANFSKITAADYDFSFDKNILELKSITNLNPTIVAANNPNFASAQFANQGKVKVSFTDAVGVTLPDNTLLYTLTFRKIGGAAAGDFAFQSVEVTDVPSGVNQIPAQTYPTAVPFLDTEYPVLVCPKDTVLYTTTAFPNSAQLFGIQINPTDNCQLQPVNYSFSGATVLSSTINVNGKFFNVGTTNVNVNVKDYASNTTTCDFKVVVRQPQVLLVSDTLDCRADSVIVDLTVKDFIKLGKFGATVEWNKDSLQYRRIAFVNPLNTVNSSALLSGSANSLSISFNSSDVLGTTIADNQVIAKITYKVLNTKINDKYKLKISVPLAQLADNSNVLAQGNNAYLSILDTEGPKIIGCPKDTILKTDKCFADYSWIAPSAADFCTSVKDSATNAPITATARINAGIKPTTFFYTYRDQYLNESTCKFNVTVLDTIKPVLSNCVANDTLQLATSDVLGTCGAVFTNSFATQPTVIESCSYTRSENYQAGNIVPIGISKHIITIKDTSGNTATCTRYIKVTDRTGPTFETAFFTPPTKILYAKADKCGTEFTWTDPIAIDNCDGAVSVTADKTKGSVFPVGSSKIVFTATDSKGIKTQNTLNIVVLDTIPSKFINCPTQAINLIANTDCEAIYTPLVVQYTDNCAPTPQDATLTGAPTNNIYPVGKTDLLYTAPGAICQVSVIVKDTIKPKIDCPTNVTKNSTAGNCFAIINSNALPSPINLSDNCGIPTYSVKPTLVQYPVGTTTLTYTAKDASNNIKECTFDIIVSDNTPPIIDCQGDVSVAADADKATATVTWTDPIATDNCGNSKVKITSDYANNTTFSIGTTVVTYTATDESNKKATCSFTVKVIDNQKPKFAACPTSTVSQPVGANCEYTFSLLKSFAVSDNHKITFRDSIGTRPNGKYPIGSYPITYIVKDSTGLDATCNFVLQVADKSAPKKLTCPADAENTFTAAAGACDVTLTNSGQLKFPSFKDDCDASPKYDTLRFENNVWVKGLPSNLLFKAGATRLAVIATDAANNTDTCFFNVVVSGNVKPAISAADCGVGNITTKATGCLTTLATPYTAPAVTFSPCATKDTTFYNFAPNHAFPIGNHTVIYTAKDKSNNTATCSFTVTIEDKDAPIITFKKDTVSVEGTDCFQTVNWDAPTVKDFPCDTSKVQLTPLINFGVYPVGISSVIYTATDKFNNSSTKTLYVKVSEKQKPTFSKCPKNVEIGIDGTVIADVDNVLDNSKITNATCDSIKLTYNLSAFSAIDNCDASPNLVFPLQNLPQKAINYGIGETSIKVVAKDKSNNEGTCDFKIIVKPFSLKPNATVSDDKPCVGDAITLKVDSIAGAIATWSSTNNFVSTNASNAIKNVTLSNSGDYFVFYQKGNCKSASDTVRFDALAAPIIKADTLTLLAGTVKSSNITINDALIKDAKYKVTWQPNTSLLGTFTGKDNGEFSFDAKKGVSGTVFPEVLYDICYDDCADACLKNQKLVIIVTKDIPTDCQVPNLLTPNGDGFNDKLEIDCLGSTTGASLTVYSQWGEIVYTSTDYKGDWDGTWKGRALPDATYFYVFKKTVNGDAKKGYITIFR